MLFPYTYVPHGIERLHSYIAHLVTEVWCKAAAPFQINLLPPPFYTIVLSNEKYLLNPITEIHGYFLQLTTAQKAMIADGFIRNNDIAGICHGNVQPMRFADLAAISQPIAKAVKDFFKNLYTNILKISAVKKECGDLDEHYDAFMEKNSNGKCPFCGLADIKSNLLSKRDAYDHYLPKDVYPFNAINFKNLVPACNACNSSYKLALDLLAVKKDPLFNNDARRKALYPFEASQADIQFQVAIHSLDVNEPKKSDLNLTVTSANNQEEVDAWRDVYGIDERYLDKCKSSDAKNWLNQVLIEAKNYGFLPSQFYVMKIAVSKDEPFYIDYNFLKIPFLESCYAAGYIQ